MKRSASHLRAAGAALALALVIAPAGCEDDKAKSTQSAASAGDAGAPDGSSSQQLLGGRLGAAVAAAGQQAQAPAPNAKGGAGPADGPPETGVFTPEGAAAAHAKGAPPKVEMLGEGAEPRAVIPASADPEAQQKLVLTLGMRMGMQALPNIDFAVAFKADKPKDDKAKKGDAKGEASPGGAAAPLKVAGKVTDATLSADQPGQIPAELAKEVAKLKGSVVRFERAADGSVGGFSYELAKEADKGLDAALKSLADALSIITAPLPAKPVGVGAYWMVTDRGQTSGAEVIRYRVFRVKSMEGGKASLAIEVRQYAAENSMRVASGPQEEMSLGIEQYDSQAKAEIELTKGGFLPGQADLSEQVVARLIPPGQAQARQRLPVQSQLVLKIAPSQ